MIALRKPDIRGIPSFISKLDDLKLIRSVGQITKLVGLNFESHGPNVTIGDVVSVKSTKNSQIENLAEVVGFRDNRILLVPLEKISDVKNGDRVVPINEGFSIEVGHELIGRIVDAFARPIDDGGNIKNTTRWKIHRDAPKSMSRRRIREPFTTGVKSIDAMLTSGLGQRVGIFSGSGVGKSSLLGMICKHSAVDVNVVSLIGERGKEVLEFIEESLGEGIKKSIVVVVTSDKPPLQRVKGAETAMAIAEYFRDQGKNVLFVMDSLTRYAMAQREIGLAVGEPPTTKGYPPSVFSLLPSLLERAGINEKGSITAFCTVLVEGDDLNDPVADTARGILDGHIVLSRELAAQGHFPSIDILGSISRVMNNVVNKDHMLLAREMRRLMSVYQKAEDMINIGAYKSGNNPQIDLAIQKKAMIDEFLIQSIDETYSFEECYNKFKALIEA